MRNNVKHLHQHLALRFCEKTAYFLKTFCNFQVRLCNQPCDRPCSISSVPRTSFQTVTLAFLKCFVQVVSWKEDMSDAHKYNFVCAGLRRFTIVGSDTKITLKVFLFYGKPAAFPSNCQRFPKCEMCIVLLLYIIQLCELPMQYMP